MKPRLLLPVLLAMLLAASAHAGPGGDHPHGDTPEWAELFSDASLPVVWQSTTAAADKIAATLATRQLGGVADWAETIHLAAHALIDQVKLPDAGRKQRLDAALEQAARLADEVLAGAQHNEPDQTAAAFRRLQSAITLAGTRLPKDITAASPQTPRFAQAPKHEGDHKH